MSEQTANLGFMLCDTARLLRRRFNSRVRTLGLTRAQWQVLTTISRYQGMHQAALAERLEIEPITLTRLLERMEKGGWVVRQADKTDRRVRCVFLSRKAAPMLLKLKAIGQQLLEETLRGVSPQTQKYLQAALMQMNDNLSDLPTTKTGRQSYEARA